MRTDHKAEISLLQACGAQSLPLLSGQICWRSQEELERTWLWHNPHRPGEGWGLALQ